MLNDPCLRLDIIVLFLFLFFFEGPFAVALDFLLQFKSCLIDKSNVKLVKKKP